jgi:hypothetical protein
MTFPATRLNFKVELALGADPTKPETWMWTDFSSRLDAQGITIHRGKADESGNLDPSSVVVELTNLDGALTPGNGASPYYPYIRRGTPLRITVEGAPPALLIPGGSTTTAPLAWASTPDHASLDITGDLDVRARIEPDAWSNGLYWVTGNRNLTPIQRICGKWGTLGSPTTDQSWIFSLAGPGWPILEWTTGGTAATETIIAPMNSPTLAASGPLWVGFTLDVNDGAGHNVVRFYQSTVHPPPADITTWELVLTSTQGGNTSIYSGAALLYVGLRAGGIPGFRGRFHALQVRNGINGTLVANPDFSAQAPGVTSFNDSTGKTWTLGGVASISTQMTRFTGYIDEIDLLWPYGDNAPTTPTTHPTESRVSITASDIVRRLGQGAKPLRSTFYREASSIRRADLVLGYWPFEDPQGVALASGGIEKSQPLQTIGVDFGAESTLPSSGPLARVQANTTAYIQGDIAPDPIGRGNGRWAVDWVVNIPTFPSDPALVQIMNLVTSGTAARWVLALSNANARLDTYDVTGNLLASDTVGFASTSCAGRWVLWHLEATDIGGISWSWTYIVLDTGDVVTHGGTVVTAPDVGYPARIDIGLTAPADGLSLGHIIVSEGSLPVGWLAGTDTAWVGESAAHRLFRLASEIGVPMEIIGDTKVFLDSSGTIRGTTVSQAMGPQSRDTFLALLAETAAVDGGDLFSRSTAPGLAYRLRSTIQGQAAPALVLDARLNHITLPLLPRLDDQRLRNSVIVAATSGSEATYTDTASVAAEGRYEVRVELNGVGGVDIQDAILTDQPGLLAAQIQQNRHQAAWRTALGTWPGMRWPTITIDLATAPSLIQAAHGLDIGDRITLTGLPVQYPAETVELIVEAIDDQLDPTGWLMALTCSSGEPWLVGILNL